MNEAFRGQREPHAFLSRQAESVTQKIGQERTRLQPKRIRSDPKGSSIIMIVIIINQM